MYSVKINTSNTEELEKVLKVLEDSLKYTEQNWNSPERNPAMLVGYLQATIRESIYNLDKEIVKQTYLK